MGKNCGGKSHSKLCQCDGKPEPDILEKEVFVEWSRTTVRFKNLGLSKFNNGEEKWYVYFTPPLKTKRRNRITRMGIGAWRWNVHNQKSK
jgi:hypothetical protein